MATASTKQVTLLLLLFSILLPSCNKEKLFEGPDAFQDDFESYSSLEDMLLEGDSLWSFAQITLDGNTIEVDSTFSHTGNKCIRFEDVGTSGSLSKCSLVKQKMAFWEGETVYFSVWFYLAQGNSSNWLFLVDLEEQAAISAGPGMRMAIAEDTALLLEHKFPNPNVHQDESSKLSIPRDQWFHLEMETLLSQKENGYVKIWQDGRLIIDQSNWQTLPKDILTIQQGTKGMYSSIEVGLTANPSPEGQVLYMDDLEIRLIP